MSYGYVEFDELLNAFKCEICGKWCTNLSYHIPFHGMTVKEYRIRYGLSRRVPLCSIKNRLDKRRRWEKMKDKVTTAPGGPNTKEGRERIANLAKKGHKPVVAYEQRLFYKTQLSKLGVAARKKKAKERAKARKLEEKRQIDNDKKV